MNRCDLAARGQTRDPPARDGLGPGAPHTPRLRRTAHLPAGRGRARHAAVRPGGEHRPRRRLTAGRRAGPTSPAIGPSVRRRRSPACSVRPRRRSPARVVAHRPSRTARFAGRRPFCKARVVGHRPFCTARVAGQGFLLAVGRREGLPAGSEPSRSPSHDLEPPHIGDVGVPASPGGPRAEPIPSGSPPSDPSRGLRARVPASWGRAVTSRVRSAGRGPGMRPGAPGGRCGAGRRAAGPAPRGRRPAPHAGRRAADGTVPRPCPASDTPS